MTGVCSKASSGLVRRLVRSVGSAFARSFVLGPSVPIDSHRPGRRRRTKRGRVDRIVLSIVRSVEVLTVDGALGAWTRSVQRDF